MEKFAYAAFRANLAGFDGVEIHAAHGYLVNEFLSPYTNKRTDEYGGNLRNRVRFLVEIIRQIKTLVGRNFVIGVRLSVEEFVPGGLKTEEVQEIARVLEAEGVSYLSTKCGIYESVSTIIKPMLFEEGWRIYLAEVLKKVVSCPIIAGGVIRHPEIAEKIISEGKADFGRVTIRGKQVVVVSGGMMGCKTSLFLAEQDNWITLIEMLPKVAYDVEVIARIELLKELNRETLKS